MGKILIDEEKVDEIVELVGLLDEVLVEKPEVNEKVEAMIERLKAAVGIEDEEEEGPDGVELENGGTAIRTDLNG